MYMIIGAVLGLCFFVVPFWSYRRGLKDGLSISSGNSNTIEPIKNPVQVYKEHKQEKQGIENITKQAEDANKLIQEWLFGAEPTK